MPRTLILTRTREKVQVCKHKICKSIGRILCYEQKIYTDPDPYIFLSVLVSMTLNLQIAVSTPPESADNIELELSTFLWLR